MENKPRVPVILGSTGVGKTAVAILVAQRLNAEIISADSRQIYRGMDIGTAKPSVQEQSQCIHHLIDILDPDQVFSAGEFVRRAFQAVEEIKAKGKIPLMVGGAGLYIQALTEGIFSGNARDLDLRRRLEAIYDRGEVLVLYDKLKSIDPRYAQIVHPHDRKKLIRALEIYEVSGLTISQLSQYQDDGKVEGVLCGISLPRKVLYEHINLRVEKMLNSGLVEEVQGLKKRGYNASNYAMNSPGYREVFQFLDGKRNREQMVELIKRDTRRYAKRQITYFARMKKVKWFDASSGIENTAENIADYLTNTYKLENG